MKLAAAIPIAQRVRDALAPFCTRIEIAGSIRRRKPEVGDIEIVAIPLQSFVCNLDLFGHEDQIVHDRRFSAAVRDLGRIVKGDIDRGRYIQIQLPDGIAVDLFIARPDNWGLILAIRTGSAEYSHRVLACGWVRAGYHSLGGMLCTIGHKVPVLEERDLFELIGVKWVEPQMRNL